MDLAQAAISTFVTITVIIVLLAGVFKIFQIASELGEIKGLLKDIRNNAQDSLAEGRVSSVRALATERSEPNAARTASMLRSLSADEYAAALQAEVVSSTEAHREP